MIVDFIFLIIIDAFLMASVLTVWKALLLLLISVAMLRAFKMAFQRSFLDKICIKSYQNYSGSILFFSFFSRTVQIIFSDDNYLYKVGILVGAALLFWGSAFMNVFYFCLLVFNIFYLGQVYRVQANRQLIKYREDTNLQQTDSVYYDSPDKNKLQVPQMKTPEKKDKLYV